MKGLRTLKVLLVYLRGCLGSCLWVFLGILLIADAQVPTTTTNNLANTPDSAVRGYVDLSQSDFPDALLFLSERGLLQGYPSGEIRPKNLISRAELVTLIARELALAEQAGNCFADVQTDDWYAPFVCQAAQLGIVSGYAGSERFRPHRPASYAEAIKLVSEAFGLLSTDLLATDLLGATANATDANAADANENWFVPYARLSERNNLVPDVDYLPEELITRDVTAELVKRAILLAANPEARRSSGCGLVRQPLEQINLNLNGVRRAFLDVIPANYDSDTQHGLVFAFHANAGGSSGRSLQEQLELDQHLSQTIVVYPEGQRDGPRNLWSDPEDNPDNLRDYALFDALYDLYTNRYCIDLGRVYVLGVGMGGWFANSLACARANTVRAVATISGSISPSDCPGRVATLLLHNPANGQMPLRDVLAARDHWLAHNDLPNDPDNTLLTDALTVFDCQRYGDANNRFPVMWCPYRQQPERTVPTDVGRSVAAFFTDLP